MKQKQKILLFLSTFALLFTLAAGQLFTNNCANLETAWYINRRQWENSTAFNLSSWLSTDTTVFHDITNNCAWAQDLYEYLFPYGLAQLEDEDEDEEFVAAARPRARKEFVPPAAEEKTRMLNQLSARSEARAQARSQTKAQTRTQTEQDPDLTLDDIVFTFTVDTMFIGEFSIEYQLFLQSRNMTQDPWEAAWMWHYCNTTLWPWRNSGYFNHSNRLTFLSDQEDFQLNYIYWHLGPSVDANNNPYYGVTEQGCTW